MPFLRLHDASVVFPVHTERSMSLRHSFIMPKVGALLRKSTQTEVRFIDALQNITFELETSDRLGLIGHNGAGKSTLLRVLAGVYAPTNGSIESQGKKRPLFNLGLALHGESSGIDNIFALGLLQGQSRREIISKLDEIITFSGLEEYVNLPVRTYSSGMALRLAFSVATCWPPEIFLVDEVMDAGDAEFRTKAKERIQIMLAGAGIVVYASHSMADLRQFCNKGLVLNRGRAAFLGAIDGAIDYYQKLIAGTA
jgi:homopolymeric O-antigen transport system ATP-binding protein